jgi:hypothetical protein
MRFSRKELPLLSLGLGVSLLLLSSIVVDASRVSLQLSDFTPTAYAYVPYVVREPTNMPTLWKFERQCENPDGYTVGTAIWRNSACDLLVHGQFGCASTVPWLAKSGYVRYASIIMPGTDQLFLSLRYSKDSGAYVPVQVYIDSEAEPRATFFPANQGDWERFAWTDPIPLGPVAQGAHTIRFYTDGQQYGVADLDMFCLANYAAVGQGCGCG